MQGNHAQMHIVKQACQCIECSLAQLDAILTQGGNRRGCMRANRQIIKTDNADILRDSLTELLALLNDRVGKQIMTAYNCGNTGV